MKAPTGKQYESYEHLFDFFNNTLFEGKLASCLLVFSSRGVNITGHFAKSKWQRSDQVVHEININPAYLALASDICIASTLVHEMVHLWQAQFGKAGKGGYHNKEWGVYMERIGLMPSHTGKPGGNKIGFKMDHYIIKGGKFEQAFNRMPKKMLLPFKTKLRRNPNKRKGSKEKVKYSCPKCSANLWGKPGLIPICGVCMVPMKSKDKIQNLDHKSKIELEALRIAVHFLDSIRDTEASKETIIFQFADSLIEDLFKIKQNEYLEKETKLKLLYRLGETIDMQREKGALHDFINGRYVLN